MIHPNEEMMSIFEKRITFDVTDLPELKDWKIGEGYTLHLDVIQESRHEVQGAKMTSTFVIKRVKAGKDKKDESYEAMDTE